MARNVKYYLYFGASQSCGSAKELGCVPGKSRMEKGWRLRLTLMVRWQTISTATSWIQRASQLSS